MMRITVLLALMCAWLSGCQLAQNAASNAKPASPPQVYDNAPSSAWWADESKFYLGSTSFAMRINYNLFNQISVKLQNVDAEQLPRGTVGGPGIDKRALAAGKVYYRLTSISSDVNAQKAYEYLEIVDLAGILKDSGSPSSATNPRVVTEADLVVGERSINPQYKGTADEYKESTYRVVFSRDFVGPVGAFAPQCTLSINGLPDPTSIFNPTLRAGDTLSFSSSFAKGKCKQVKTYVKDQLDVNNFREIASKTVANPDQATGLYASASMVIPAQDNSSWIKIRVEGLDWLRRPTYVDGDAWVEYTRQPPPKPCALDNGNNGLKQNFSYCGQCEDAPAVSHLAAYCSAAEGKQTLEQYLTSIGGKQCDVKQGSCPACPSDNGAGGALINQDYCVTCNGRNSTITLLGICDKDKGQEFLESTQRQNDGAACTVKQGVCH